MEEIQRGRLQLRFCPTGVMAADGLTKLATSHVMEAFRGVLSGKPFDIPSSSAEFLEKSSAAQAYSTLQCEVSFGNLPMVERRRRADRLAHSIVLESDVVTDEQLRQVLMTWGFAKNRSRKNVAPASEYIWSETFGLVYDRTGRWIISTATRLFPSIAKVLNMWFRSRLRQLSHPAFSDPLSTWHWTGITVNRGYAAARHVDANNHGPSVIRSIASSSDRLRLWPRGDKRELSTLSPAQAVELPIASTSELWAFDGRCPHETKPCKSSVTDRLSIIFFQASRGWKADPDTTSRLCDLGFVPAATMEDAARFDAKFGVLTGGDAYTCWRVTDT